MWHLAAGSRRLLQSVQDLNIFHAPPFGPKADPFDHGDCSHQAAVSGLVNVTTEEKQLLNTVLLGAGQLSKGITSATWHAMLDDHREAAYQVMQTIALKQGIDRIRMFNSAGHVTFSTN